MTPAKQNNMFDFQVEIQQGLHDGSGKEFFLPRKANFPAKLSAFGLAWGIARVPASGPGYGEVDRRRPLYGG